METLPRIQLFETEKECTQVLNLREIIMCSTSHCRCDLCDNRLLGVLSAMNRCTLTCKRFILSVPLSYGDVSHGNNNALQSKISHP